MTKLSLFLILFSSISYSQETIKKNLNLEDISIKGELLSDSRMNLIKRKKEELKNRVKFRTQYREEILQEYTTP
jgi:hypothetical protein